MEADYKLLWTTLKSSLGERVSTPIAENKRGDMTDKEIAVFGLTIQSIIENMDMMEKHSAKIRAQHDATSK